MGKLKKVKRVVKLIPRAFTTLPKLKFYFGWHYTHTPVNEHQMLFESFHGKNISDSPLYVLKELMARGEADKYTIYFATNAKSKAEHEKLVKSLGLPVRLVDVESRAYPRVLATSKYLINNSSFPAYFMRRPEQRYVQPWHGTPLKRLGDDVQVDTTNALNTTDELAGRFEMDSAKWTYLISPSPFTSQHLSDAFGLPEERRPSVVLEVGYPRNDAIARACETPESLAAAKARIMEELGVPQGKKLLLYAPTWRDNEYKGGLGYVQDTLIDFDQLQRELSDEWCILFRPHYYIANEFDFSRYGDFVYNAAMVPDINDLYIIADALMTDYSSVFFDYSVTGRPLLFYWPDYEYYNDHVRGFYFDPHTIPGPKCTTTDEVVAAVKGLDAWMGEYGEAYEDFRAQFCPKDDGHASERAIERIFFPKTDEQSETTTS